MDGVCPAGRSQQTAVAHTDCDGELRATGRCLLGSVETGERGRSQAAWCCGHAGIAPCHGLSSCCSEGGGQEEGSPQKNKSRDFLRLLVPGGKTLNVW